MNILGLSCYYHDSAACLLRDGVVVSAVAEERLSRKKHDNGFPAMAIKHCLDWSNLSMQEVDIIAFYEKPLVKFERVISQHLDAFPMGSKVFRENIGSWFTKKLAIGDTLRKKFGYGGRLVYVPHHMSHAASAFYPSGFNTSAIVTIDGVGEWATTTVGIGRRNDISLDHEIRFPHSLGLLYSAVTAYLGFEVNDAEYKVMGYAAYGNPLAYSSKFAQLLFLHSDGSFSLNMKYFDYTRTDRMYGRALEELFGMPTREKDSGIQKEYADIAAGLQQSLEQAVFHILVHAYKRYKTSALCLSGGVALNSVMNGKVLSNSPFTRLYIPPDPGDAGGAMGAAMYTYMTCASRDVRKITPFFPNVGPSYAPEQIKNVLDGYKLSYIQAKDESKLIDIASSLLAKQKVVGWFQGRMEWGPRALGFRSILASARDEKMKDVINAKVKHRELFRPFAPAIINTHVNEYFKTDTHLSESAKYMLMVYPFTPRGLARVPATVHVDGTGRLQIVERADNPLYFDLIKEFFKKTGTPVILNTSFNVRGEPIVCTPRDAVKCFLKTDIDYLIIDRFIVKK